MELGRITTDKVKKISMKLSVAKHFAKCMCGHENSNTKLLIEEKEIF